MTKKDFKVEIKDNIFYIRAFGVTKKMENIKNISKSEPNTEMKYNVTIQYNTKTHKIIFDNFQDMNIFYNILNEKYQEFKKDQAN